MRRPPSPEHPRSVTILGATGSVGRSTVAVLDESPGCYRVVALTANRNAVGLAALARRLGAGYAAVADPTAWGTLREALAGSGIEAGAGPEAVAEAASRAADWVMAAIVGAAGLVPTLVAIRRGALVALANKEPLVCAGNLLMAEAQAHGATLLPVDSEHNAIFQATAGATPGSIERIVLTASGGPFRTRAVETLATVTPEEAIAHPNWSMGAKISVDSATMMNKGLEVIEAHYLFELPEDRIEVVIHPQSVIHGLVGYSDGSLLAQAGAADMRIPIASALGWPGRLVTTAPRLDLAAIARLDFAAPDTVRFPALALARAALRAAGAAPIVLNAANEVAVAAFLERRARFTDIARIVADVLEQHRFPDPTDIAYVIACDAEARRLADAALVAHGASAPLRIPTEAR